MFRGSGKREASRMLTWLDSDWTWVSLAVSLVWVCGGFDGVTG
jgi:hypothetical protein